MLITKETRSQEETYFFSTYVYIHIYTYMCKSVKYKELHALPQIIWQIPEFSLLLNPYAQTFYPELLPWAIFHMRK